MKGRGDEEGANNRMEVFRNLCSLHTINVGLPMATESSITARKRTGSMIDATNQTQRLGDTNVDGKIILQRV
jgi:hypothetical protein